MIIDNYELMRTELTSKQRSNDNPYLQLLCSLKLVVFQKLVPDNIESYFQLLSSARAFDFEEPSERGSKKKVYNS